MLVFYPQKDYFFLILGRLILNRTFWGIVVEGIFMTNAIVKYHNDVNTVSLRGFTAAELDIFVAILSCMRDKGEDIITFTFNEIKKLVHWKPKDNERFLLLLKNTYDKLLKCNIKIGNNIDWTSFVLFTKYTVSGSTGKVTIAVNPEFQYTLNLLTSNFTRFELEEFLSLKSTYAKEFYRHMKQFKSSGFWKVSLDEFKRVMDIPEKYSTDAIDRKVLTPIMSELGNKYRLKIVKLHDKTKRGRPPVCGFEFTFLKDTDRGNADVIDAETKTLSAKAKKQEPQRAPTPRTPKKPQKPDIELKESVYLMRTMKVRDKKFKDNLNYLKIIDIDYNPENGVNVKVKNMDDDYINTMHFDSIRLLDKFFNEHVVS